MSAIAVYLIMAALVAAFYRWLLVAASWRWARHLDELAVEAADKMIGKVSELLNSAKSGPCLLARELDLARGELRLLNCSLADLTEAVCAECDEATVIRIHRRMALKGLER